MSQALDDKLAELGTKEDAIIALVNTDVSVIASLQSANAALKASQGDDSAQVAEVQALIDKLAPVLAPATPAAPESVAAVSVLSAVQNGGSPDGSGTPDGNAGAG